MDIWFFFNSLKLDYLEFPRWFSDKTIAGESAFVYKEEKKILAFLYLKNEEEPIELLNMILPSKKRIKIGTLKLDDSIHGQRIGEGAIGVALWRWQRSKAEEIYITTFNKHKPLIDLIDKFGFDWVGKNKRGEEVYLRSKKKLNYDDPFKTFPFLNPSFKKAGYIPINDDYHDTLFPYSKLSNTKQEAEEIAAANGITKVFIGAPYSTLHHQVGEPVIIYRIHKGLGPKKYKSVATSFCTLTNLITVKSNGNAVMSIDEFTKLAGNKTVFTKSFLKDFFNKKENIVLIEMVYNGFFGTGHNVTYKELEENALFDRYPYNVQLSRQQFISILEMGGKNVQDVIVDKSRTC